MVKQRKERTPSSSATPKESRDRAIRDLIWRIAASVTDPDIPVLSIVDLGVLREVKVENGAIEVLLAPTHSGFPAMHLIAMNLECAIEDAGYGLPRVTTLASPAWTADWMTEEGKAKLRTHGIAPPRPLPVRAARRPSRPTEG